METRRIGSLEVSVIGLGTNNFGFSMEADEVGPVVDAALEAGINFIDTADSYRDSEERLGRALGKRRDQVVIATKFGSPVEKGGPRTARPDYVRQAVERSLQKLGTDRIDLYQLHRPDPETPIGDTLVALDELVRQGKVREIGCSNFSAAQLREAADAVGTGAAGFVSVQNELNLLHREDEQDVLPECEQRGLAYLPYVPLASGMLSGKYRRNESPPEGSRLSRGGDRAEAALSDRNFDIVDALSAYARDHEHTILELAIAWLLAKPVVASVIAGATKADQAKQNVASYNWRLTPQEVSDIEALTL